MVPARAKRRNGGRATAIALGFVAISLVTSVASATGNEQATPRGGSACDAANDAISDAKRDVKKAKRALAAADTPRAKKEARRNLRKAKQRLEETEADKEDVCGLVRFAVIGAQGKGNIGQVQVAGAIDAKCEASGCDYVVGLGNNIFDEGATSTSSPEFTDKFETPYAGIDLPFWLGLGNHDYGLTGTDAFRAQVQVDYSAVSPSGNWKMPAKYYRRPDRHVEFFTLDTTPQMFGTDAQQETDVSGWLGNSSARWKIALGLHSYRSNGQHGNAGTYDGLPPGNPSAGAGVRDFMEDHVCGEADVYFSAFDHTLQWPQEDTATCPGTELIVSGTAASSTELDGTAYPTHFQSEALGFAYVKIKDDEMTVDFIDVAGTVLFSRTITK